MHFRAALMHAGAIAPPQGPLRDKYMDEKGRESLVAARSLYGEAVKIIARSGCNAFPEERYFSLLPPQFIGEDSYRQALRKTQNDWNQTLAGVRKTDKQSAGELATQSLKHAVDSLNYLEDHPERDVAHLWVHRSGALRAATIGCAMTVENGKVWRTCPVSIVHIRAGLSPGFTTRQVCSICRKSVAICDHFPGEYYEIIASKDASGRCNICNEEACAHEPAITYFVEARVDWGIGRVQEFSFVRRPRNPLARLTRMTEDLAPGSNLHQGAIDGSLHCTECLMPCPGFTRPFDDDLLHPTFDPIDSAFPDSAVNQPGNQGQE